MKEYDTYILRHQQRHSTFTDTPLLAGRGPRHSKYGGYVQVAHCSIHATLASKLSESERASVQIVQLQPFRPKIPDAGRADNDVIMAL